MTGEELWRRKTDQEVLDAVSLFHEYTEVGQAILIDELQRRGLPCPPALASSCLQCGTHLADAAAVCHACGAAVHPASAGVAQAAPATLPAGVTFFEVGTQKFVVMFVCTFGLYGLYWFYENWRRIKEAKGRVGAAGEGAGINPFWRAFFAPFWAYALFREVRDAARAAGLEVRWNPGILAMAYVAANLFYRLANSLHPLPDQASVLSLFSVLFLLPVQQAMQRVNQVRGDAGDQNASYDPANIMCIILGAFILVLVLFGSFLDLPK